jgi:sterol desaturase/sphingolipid hydroxylase (fatty acid hydroxylase superfamily)
MESTIESLVLEQEVAYRLGFFAAIFTVMLVWELLAPRRVLSVSKLQRWANNLGLLLLNSVVLRFLFPAAAVGIAYSVNDMGWGLFNWLALPFWVEVVVAVLLLDLAIYLQHLMMHRVPLLWRLHRVHHADLDIDLTTGSRFHTIEIVVSMLIKWGVIALLGPALLAVLVFEILLNGMALFNHANVRLPRSVDRWVRGLLVTPDMHRVHHSILRDETYIDQPQRGHDAMTIGIPEFRDPRQVDRLPGMLALPFRSRV